MLQKPKNYNKQAQTLLQLKLKTVLPHFHKMITAVLKT